VTGRSQDQLDMTCPDCPAILPTRQGWQIHRRRKHGWVPTEKTCTRCQVIKPVGAFGPVNRHTTRPRSECRECRSRPSTQTVAQLRGERKRYAGSRYGLTPYEYENLIEYLTRKQAGKCAICGRKKLLTLDHCHTTGLLRALLCRTCNAGLGMFQDNQEWLGRAINYLKG
jgi:hypothetical protein